MMKLVDSISVVIQGVGWNKKLTIKSEAEVILLQKEKKKKLFPKKKRKENRKQYLPSSIPNIYLLLFYKL